jgi:dienelactone hydrolase
VKFIYWSCFLNIVFVADIFGLTDEFESLCQEVTHHVDKVFDVECQMIGPYQIQPTLFASEQDAYQHFMDNVALDGYVKKIAHQLHKISGPKLLIGFSVGGSAIWQLLSQQVFNHTLHAICFYSGQIRHLTKLTPNIPIRLILPAFESHFSIADLQAELKGKSLVTVEQCEYLHGFMNKCSVNYNQYGYLSYMNKLVGLLSHQLVKSHVRSS